MSASPDSQAGGRRAHKWVLGGVIGLFVVAVVLLRQVLTPVIIALVLAYIFDPLLSWAERHRVQRWLATTVLYIVVLTLFAIAATTLGPRIWNQTHRLYRAVSTFAQDYGSSMLAPANIVMDAVDQPMPGQTDDAVSDGQARVVQDDTGETLDQFGHEPANRFAVNVDRKINERLPDWGQHLRDYLRLHADEIAGRVASLAVSLGQNAAKGLSSAASFVFGLVVILVFTFFFMLHFHQMVETVKRYIPAAQRERTLRIVGRIDEVVSSFFRGRLLVCMIAGVVYVIGLRLSGIDFWLLIGLVGGILGFIPVLGVILPLIPACAFALVTGHPWGSLLGVIITFSIVQWLVEPIAGTLILSHQVRMHPVTIMLALLVGGSLFGVFGMIVSIPLAAVVRILSEEFVLPTLREQA